MKILTITSLLMLCVGPSADAAAWRSIGPSPPPVEAPVAVHSASGTIYIGSFGGGVLKSTDGGATFASVNSGLGVLAISAMAINPTNPSHVVVGTAGNGIFRTVNGGETWTATSESAGVIVFLAVDPLDSRIWYAGYMGTSILKKSVDGGATWVNTNSGIPTNSSVWSIVPDPHNSGVVYASTAGSGAFKSTNAGVSWSPISIQPVVWYLAIDPTDSRVIYAAVNGDGVLKSTDAGATFSRVGSPRVGVVISLVVDPTDSRQIYAGTASGGVELSKDGGKNWKKTSIARGIAIALSVTEEGDVYVGTAFDGVFASSSSGNKDDDDRQSGAHRSKGRRFVEVASAELRAINAQNIVNIVLDPRDSQHLLLGTNDGGLLGSTNGGNDWIDVGKGFLSRASRRPVFDPRITGRVYAGSFNGGGLYRSDDNGFTWTRHIVGSPAAYVWSAGVDPFTGAVYAGTQNNEGLWRSTDEANTFTRIDGGQIAQVRDIVFDTSTPGKMFIAAIGGLFRSLDGGTTFSRIATGAINTITIDRTNANVVYAGTQTAGVLKSIDGGATFVASNSGLITTFNTSRGNGVIVHPTNPSTLYVGTEGAGVFKSVDAGASWFEINDGLSNLRVFGLALDPTRPSVLYAGSAYGVFKTETGGQ